MDIKGYQQYQLTLSSEDVVADHIAELAQLLKLPFDEEDYDAYWFTRDKDYAYLVRDPGKNPNVFILVVLRSEGEFDQLVVRCKSEDAEKVKDLIRNICDEEFYRSAYIDIDFTDRIHDSQNNWIPRLIKEYNLDLNDII